MKLINRSIEVPICLFHVKVVIAMLAIVPSFVLFYLGYVSYVSFHCRLVFQFEPAYGIRHDFAWNIVQLNAVYIVVKNSCRVRLTLLTILRM